MKITLIGEFNPYSPDPKMALYPIPAAGAGARGARVMRALDMSEDAYLSTFVRHDLLHEPRWSVPEARRRARDILRTSESRMVLLGARVAAAFGLTPFWGFCFQQRTVVLHGDVTRRVLVLPHPSGRSRAWNEPYARDRARAAFARLRAEEQQPYIICTCPASSEFDSPCPRHGLQPIGQRADGSYSPPEYDPWPVCEVGSGDVYE